MKKIVIAALIALTAAGSIASTANASGLKLKKFPLHHHHHQNHDGAIMFGAGLAAIGLLAAASQARAEPAYDCWTEKRVRYDRDGYRYVKRVRVCE